MVSKKTLTEQVYQYLKERITNLHMPPGTKIEISDIAKELGVSTTPVREAVHKLIQRGLVVAKPYTGFFVVELSPEDIEDLFDLRKALELLALSYVVQRLDELKLDQLLQRANKLMESSNPGDLIDGVRKFDEEFHLEFLIGTCGNKWLVKMANGVIDLVKMTTRMTLNPRVACEEHMNILKAMKSRNTELARELLEIHLERAKREAVENARRSILGDGSL